MPEKETQPAAIALNRKATHDYFIEDREEAGLALTGWEVKSLRAGRAQIGESYVILRANEAWLLGAHIAPLTSASTWRSAKPTASARFPSPSRS